MRTLRHLAVYLRPYRRQLLASLAAVALFTLLSVVSPLLMRYLLDHVIQARDWRRLGPVAAAILAVPVGAVAIRLVGVQILTHASRHFLNDLRLALYHKVLQLPMRYHAETPSGTLAGRIVEDIGILHQLISQNTVQVIVDVVVFVCALALATTIAPPLALMLAAALTLYIFVYRHFSRRIRVATASYRSLYDEISGRMQETVSGVRQVRIYNREPYESDQFLDRTGRSLACALEARLGTIGLSTACSAVQQISGACIVGTGAWLVLQRALTYGDLLAFGAYMGFVFAPAVRLLNVAGQMEETMVSANRIVEILDEDTAIRERPGAVAMRRGPGLIEFEGVHFSYVSGQPVYRGLDLRIEAGQSVAFVGPTGCGKSTLAALLLRFWDVQSGAIRIDGVDLRDMRLKSLRRLIGVVPQDPTVFSGTIAENIAYGLPSAAAVNIEAAARVAEIHAKIASFPKGYETRIGPYGVRLSRGERQRICIARAVLLDPEILIMDEATSALDSESEALIQKALTKVLHGRTCLMIAHRLSTVMGCNRIDVMKAGAIVESGCHEELIARPDGFYRRLHAHLRGNPARETA